MASRTKGRKLGRHGAVCVGAWAAHRFVCRSALRSAISRFGVRLGRDQSGQSTTEYVLIIGLVSIPIYLALSEVIDYLLYEMMRQIIENFTTG